MQFQRLFVSWFTSRSVLYALIGCIGIITLLIVNRSFLVTIPDVGGSMTEGIIGVPRFINPLLAISDADRDLTSLVYSGLMTISGDGNIVPDLAQGYTVSEDGTVYTFTLRDDLTFHDGTPLTASDVVFTVTLAQDNLLKSPKRPNWEGVLVSSPDESTVIFQLTEPFAPFIENTTLGILPAHLWDLDSSDLIPFSNYNSIPIGSGPFKIATIERDGTGIPYAYTLRRFDDYSRGAPYLDSIRFEFFTNYDELFAAYDRGDVEAIHSIPSAFIDTSDDVHSLPLARVFGVYFNQDFEPLFTNGSIRRALNARIDRDALVRDVLHGFAAPISSPLPATNIPESLPATSSDAFIAQAVQILTDANWVTNEETGVLEREFDDELEVGQFTLTTVAIPELVAVAEHLQSIWSDIGFDVTIEALPINELNSQVIRPREYDALLFGQVVRAPHDLFAFWHSSQRNDPGLNVALYANISADAALRDLRSTRDDKVATDALDTIFAEMETDVPALFLYTPAFVYYSNDNIKGRTIQRIATPSDRFADIYSWYRYTQDVWPAFQ